MKKYFVVLVAAVAILAVASPSLAQFKSWGHMEVESYWQYYGMAFDKNQQDNRRAMAERFRFYLQYGDPKTVRAVIGFEADASRWGEQASPGISGQNNSGSGDTVGPSLAARNKIGSSNTDQAGLEIKWAYIEFVTPFFQPLTVAAGLQNWAIGGSLGRYFLNLDVPGLRFTTNFAPHTIEASWYKEQKGSIVTDNDADMYMLRYMLNQKMFNVESWFAYEYDRRVATNSWSLAATPSQYTTPNAAPSTATYTITDTVTARTYDARPWWLGAVVPMTLGNLTVTPTFIYEGGYARKYFNGVATPDVKINAWLANLEATYRLGPGLFFTGQGFYATGWNTKNGTQQNYYTQPAGSESRNVFGNGWSVFFFENTELTYYGHKQELFGGFAFGRLTATYSPFTWLEIQPTYLYIWDTSNGGAASNSQTGGVYNTVGRSDADKNYVGQELNLITTLKIYDNIRYKIGFGWFLPGDVFGGNYNGPTSTRSASSPSAPQNQAWTLLTNLNYAF